ncbi:MAG: 1-hydroxycarotenoid 3,4-desaturase CrtD [Bacteroidota bacterium]
MKKAAIIGAGIAGIASAIRLQDKGYQVQVFEQQPFPGGKIAEIRTDGFRFDTGPSLFTLPELVVELMEIGGKTTSTSFSYSPLDIITKYFYPDQTKIIAFSDPSAFAAEIAFKTDETEEKVLRLLKKSEELYAITSHVFLERSLHKLSTYLRKETLASILKLHKLDAFRTLAKANAQYFNDPRVAQLFNRYATYNGSNPYSAPATLNIIPHLEHNLGAYFPMKGMYDIPSRLEEKAKSLGVTFHYGQEVEAILLKGKTVQGLQVNGEKVDSEIVVSNMDIVPTYRKLLSQVSAPEHTLKQARSSSALIFYWGMKREFKELDLHNIFFSNDYQQEFQSIWDEKSIFGDPTVYVYVSSKIRGEDAPEGQENWFVMINVPANQGQNWEELIPKARQAIITKLAEALDAPIEKYIGCEEILDPIGIETKTSSYQGALYGNSSNNKFAAFLRHPNFSQRFKGLYFCGGSVHPGGGIPLCLLSAKIVGDLVPEV